jgi:serine/threonine protein kinase
VSPPGESLALPCRFGRYRLVELLATGGMAQVYRAKSFGAEGFVKQLVIKRLDPRLASERHHTELFVNEAKLLATLNHGNIVPVFDFGRAGEDLYIAMEYVRGVSVHAVLQSLLARSRGLEPELAAFIAAEVCKGLDYAHRKTDEAGRPAGIVHRDVKPQNILLSEDGEVKIVDFGVAKLASRGEGSSLVGTLSYMAPEQADREVVDPRTDIFSLGLVLHELVAGERAYRASTPAEMLACARAARLPALPASTPPQLQAVLRRATDRDPERRYASAHEMEQELAEYLLVARSEADVADGAASSPRGRLGELVRSLATPEVDPHELVEESEPPAVEPAPREVTALDPRPPDLALIRGAAETFHSEFMTRILRELEPRRPRFPRWPVLVAVALLGLAGVVLALGLRGRPPPSLLSTRRDARAVAPPTTRPASAPASSQPASSLPTTFPAEDLVLGPRPPGPRRAGFGYLNLNTFPWSTVTIAGAGRALSTPILRLKLPTGRHTLVLENREQRLRKVVSVRIHRGTVTTRVIRLKPR